MVEHWGLSAHDLSVAAARLISISPGIIMVVPNFIFDGYIVACQILEI
jgi:hypothetical protein